ncbi:hypothetical protein MTBBW1_2120014 [Desulfamplus magnetovallimortis]|uniref:Uncharacterized protein n=1 Tax=Desulfamplus magnetovallimortis TaxID=1246637 RepID=A0A1W1HCJ5_9BACT|nr:hypothetical protein MTBBW1_2120014 [Desulfamplus magnetovallimortis]
MPWTMDMTPNCKKAYCYEQMHEVISLLLPYITNLSKVFSRKCDRKLLTRTCQCCRNSFDYRYSIPPQ